MYDGYVAWVCAKMGDNLTYEDELADVAVQLFHNFGGVLPRDEMEVLLQSRARLLQDKYYIFNLSTRKEGGSHWCACVTSAAGVSIYDSFGRTIDVKMGSKNADTGDREQRVAEVNCGQRCLAWLLLCRSHGVETAMLV